MICFGLGAISMQSPSGHGNTDLTDQQPDLFEDGLVDILLGTFCSLTVQEGSLARQLGQQPHLLAIGDLLLEKDFLGLGEHDSYQRLDRLAAQVGRGGM